MSDAVNLKNEIREKVDVCVVGAGHAGCEAALACARLGLETVIFTVSVDSIALMPCNPNIGGSSKGHLVREIDALGGEMGKNIDKTFIQSKMLNISKGPAVHSLSRLCGDLSGQRRGRAQGDGEDTCRGAGTHGTHGRHGLPLQRVQRCERLPQSQREYTF